MLAGVSNSLTGSAERVRWCGKWSSAGTSVRGSMVCKYFANPRTTTSLCVHHAGAASRGCAAHATAAAVVTNEAPRSSRYATNCGSSSPSRFDLKPSARRVRRYAASARRSAVTLHLRATHARAREGVRCRRHRRARSLQSNEASRDRPWRRWQSCPRVDAAAPGRSRSSMRHGAASESPRCGAVGAPRRWESRRRAAQSSRSR